MQWSPISDLAVYLKTVYLICESGHFIYCKLVRSKMLKLLFTTTTTVLDMKRNISHFIKLFSNLITWPCPKPKLVQYIYSNWIILNCWQSIIQIYFLSNGVEVKWGSVHKGRPPLWTLHLRKLLQHEIHCILKMNFSNLKKMLDVTALYSDIFLKNFIFD